MFSARLLFIPIQTLNRYIFPKYIAKQRRHLQQHPHPPGLLLVVGSTAIWEFPSDVKTHTNQHRLGPTVLPLLKKSNFKILVWHYFVWTTTDFIKK